MIRRESSAPESSDVVAKLDFSQLSCVSHDMQYHVEADDLVNMFNEFMGDTEGFEEIDTDDALNEESEFTLNSSETGDPDERREILEEFAKTPAEDRGDVNDVFMTFLYELAARGYLPYGSFVVEYN